MIAHVVSIVHTGRILRPWNMPCPSAAYCLHRRANRGTSNVAEESKFGAAGLKPNGELKRVGQTTRFAEPLKLRTGMPLGPGLLGLHYEPYRAHSMALSIAFT
jgi:hypothetical protein